jgi:predicted permease
MIEQLITKMAGLFLLMGIGFFLKRRGLTKAAHLEGLAWIVIDVCMPALFFTGLIQTSVNTIDNKGLLIVGGFLVSVLGWVLGRLALGLSGKRLENEGTFLFLCAVGNSSFLPLPLAETLWGPAGLQACFFYVLGNNLFLFSVGIALLRGYPKDEKYLILKGILHPQAIATALALASVALGLSWPAWAMETLTQLGKSTIPLAMLVAGGLLAGVNFKSIDNKGLLASSQALKLLLLPVLVGFTLKILHLHGVWAGLLFLEASMPCLASSGVYALRFGGDVKLATSGSFWSHLAALVTVPLLFWLFGFAG